MYQLMEEEGKRGVLIKMSILHFSKKLFPLGKARNGELWENINSTEKFAAILEREIARADRNGQGFSLVSFEMDNSDLNSELYRKFQHILSERLREADVFGWLDSRHIGALLDNTPLPGAWNFVRSLEEKITPPDSLPRFTVNSYPADWRGDDKENKVSQKNSAEEMASEKRGTVPESDFRPVVTCRMPLWKRSLDIVGAAIGLLILSPLFLLISVFIKIVSPGPVFLKQERIGYGGKPFVLLKFRTMKVDVDTTAHQQLLSDLINGGAHGKENPMIKLDDKSPQIIPYGKFLRKTYADELPQLINVLRGEMSLIGPRPPIPYEVAEYRRWYKGRFNVVPGMTGLWQVSGKNRLTFREMVCLDIRYRQKQSIWLDIKILLKTPLVIMSGIWGHS